MSWKTRKLNRAELSIAFRNAWADAREYRKPGESLLAAFRRKLKFWMKTILDDVRTRASIAAFSASRVLTEIDGEIMQIEAADRLTKADRARLAELRSLPRAA
jgi:hypothetical protein